MLFTQGYKSQFTQEIFEIVSIATKKPPTYTNDDEQEEGIRGKFYEKELIRVIWLGIHLQSIGFQRIIAALSKQRAQFIYKIFAGASEIGLTMGGSNFRDF